jgi:hypothetical protein
MVAGYRKTTIVPRTRVAFDPSNPAHMLDFAKFVKYNGWKDGCSYLLEDPFTDIPSMIYSKIANYTLTKYMEKV